MFQVLVNVDWRLIPNVVQGVMHTAVIVSPNQLAIENVGSPSLHNRSSATA